MPNVDTCVRLCEEAICVENHNDITDRIFSLSYRNKVIIFRNKTRDEIYDSISNYKRVIRTAIIDRFSSFGLDENRITIEHGNSNNRVGADLFFTLPNGDIVDIEVKFGSHTDKAIGMDSFTRIFGTDCFSNSLNLETRRMWLRRYIDDRSNLKQYILRNDTLNEAVSKFNDHIDNQDYSLTPSQQQFMENLVINNSGGTNISNNHYLRFNILGNNMSDMETIQTGIGRWLVDRVNAVVNETDRVNIYTKNHSSSVHVKYVLNWKNNYKHNNESLQAKLGFGSPSWNVWVTVEIITISNQ